jgi:hypothetical protein
VYMCVVQLRKYEVYMYMYVCARVYVCVSFCVHVCFSVEEVRGVYVYVCLCASVCMYMLLCMCTCTHEVLFLAPELRQYQVCMFAYL